MVELLGIFLLMDRNNERPVEYLKWKVKEFKSNVIPVKVSWFQMKLGLDMNIMKMLEYSMKKVDL